MIHLSTSKDQMVFHTCSNMYLHGAGGAEVTTTARGQDLAITATTDGAALSAQCSFRTDTVCMI